MDDGGQRARWMKLRGEPTPPGEGVVLRAGKLSAVYFPGEVRYVLWHCGEDDAGVDVALRVYAAVRDENWGTVPTTLEPPSLRQWDDGFDVTVPGRTTQAGIGYRFELRLSGRASGDGSAVLRVAFSGEATSAFRRNRIGLCVLHPASLAGLPLRVRYVGGGSAEARFPRLLDPRQPPPGLTELAGLSHPLPGVDGDGSGEVTFAFSGDAFEMEDQRNWTDASFKTFCTPLGRPFPVQVNVGDPVEQAVEVTVRGDGGGRGERRAGVSRRGRKGEVSLSPLIGVKPERLPALGTLMPSQPLRPTPTEREDLRRAGLSHLRVEVPLGRAEWRERLSAGALAARELGCGLELAVYVPATPEPTWAAEVSEAARKCGAPVRFITLLHETERYGGQPFPPPGGVAGASLRRELLLGAEGVRVAVGTDGDAIFLGRMTGLPPPGADTLAVQINPQTHASDERSMLETLGVQAVVVETAAVLGLGRAVAATPVTLRARRNLYAYATGNFAPLPPDARVKSVWAAGWTLGSLAALVSARGVAWVTFHPAWGEGGMACTPTSLLLRTVCTSGARAVWPLRVPSADELPPTCTAMALRAGEGRRLLLANHTPEVLRVEGVAEVLGTGRVSVLRLDETFEPGVDPTPRTEAMGGAIELSAYAVAVVEAAAA
ncbi:MAG: hypothetical protein ACK4PI_00170 [Tepidisphaerales bacterium]